MSIIKELLEIQKDINLLEEFGDYKSAKILHGKFVRLAQTSNADPKASSEQNKNFNEYATMLKKRKTENKLEDIQDYVDDLSKYRYERVSIDQQKHLLGYAKKLLILDQKSPVPDINEVQPVATLNILEPKTTSKLTSTRQNDINKQYNPFSVEDNRPSRIHQYGDGSYTEIRINPDYSEDRLFVGKDGYRQLYKGVPPETQLVNYQSSPGNWTTGVVPVGMDPRMADPTQREFARRKNWEDSSGYSDFIARNPKATPSQIRDYIENGGLLTPEGSTSSPSTSPSSTNSSPSGPAGVLNYPGSYYNQPPTSNPSVKDSTGSAITTPSGSAIVTSSKKKFIKIAQETAPVSSNGPAGAITSTGIYKGYPSAPKPSATDSSGSASTTPTEKPNTGTNQIEVITDGSSSNSSSENKSKEPEKIEIRTETYGLLANSIASISIRQNMSMSEALDKIVSLGAYFNGKPLGTHVNFDKLKKAVSSMPQVTKKTLSPTHKQRGFIVLYALTNYVLDDNLLRYLNPPEGYEFPESMKGKPLPLSIYERVGLYRSTYPQERVFIFQKIRQQDPDSGFTGNGYLPRIR